MLWLYMIEIKYLALQIDYNLINDTIIYELKLKI